MQLQRRASEAASRKSAARAKPQQVARDELDDSLFATLPSVSKATLNVHHQQQHAGHVKKVSCPIVDLLGPEQACLSGWTKVG